MDEKDKNELKSDEVNFNLLDFGDKPKPLAKAEKANIAIPKPHAKEEEDIAIPQEADIEIQKPNAKTEEKNIVTSDPILESQIKPERLIPKQIHSIEEIKPELKKTIKELLKAIPKEEVKQLLHEMESQKEILFDKENKNAFGKLSDKDQSLIIEKMAEWDVSEDLSALNASVILSWLNNTIKESKK